MGGKSRKYERNRQHGKGSPHSLFFKNKYVHDANLSRDISVLTFIVKLHGEAVRGSSHNVLPR